MLGIGPSIPKDPVTLGAFHCVTHAADIGDNSAGTGSSLKRIASNCGRGLHLNCEEGTEKRVKRKLPIIPAHENTVEV